MRTRTGTLLATLAAAAIATAGIAGLQRHTHPDHQLLGTLDITCDTPGVGAGTVVVVTDQQGGVLATDTLGADAGGDGQYCAYIFTVDLPDAPLYGVQVGPLPPQTLPRDVLVAQGWVVSFSNW